MLRNIFKAYTNVVLVNVFVIELKTKTHLQITQIKCFRFIVAKEFEVITTYDGFT